ncbi:unnamed protein product, partial [Mesorhabditis spiculigera]
MEDRSGDDDYRELALQCQARYNDYLRLKQLVREAQDMKKSYLTLRRNEAGVRSAAGPAASERACANLSNQISDIYDRIEQTVDELNKQITKAYGLISGTPPSATFQPDYETIFGFYTKLVDDTRSSLDADDEAGEPLTIVEPDLRFMDALARMKSDALILHKE